MLIKKLFLFISLLSYCNALSQEDIDESYKCMNDFFFDSIMNNLVQSLNFSSEIQISDFCKFKYSEKIRCLLTFYPITVGICCYTKIFNPFKFLLPDFALYFDVLKYKFCNLTIGWFYRCCYLNIINLKDQDTGINVSFSFKLFNIFKCNFSFEIGIHEIKLHYHIITIQCKKVKFKVNFVLNYNYISSKAINTLKKIQEGKEKGINYSHDNDVVEIEKVMYAFSNVIQFNVLNIEFITSNDTNEAIDYIIRVNVSAFKYFDMLDHIGYLQKNDQFSKKIHTLYAINPFYKLVLLTEIFYKDEHAIIVKMLEYMKIERQKNSYNDELVSDDEYIKQSYTTIKNLRTRSCFESDIELDVIKYLKYYEHRMSSEAKTNENTQESETLFPDSLNFFKGFDSSIQNFANEENIKKIKKVYKQQAILLHPDRNIGKDKELAAIKFKELSANYDVLKQKWKFN